MDRLRQRLHRVSGIGFTTWPDYGDAANARDRTRHCRDCAHAHVDQRNGRSCARIAAVCASSCGAHHRRARGGRATVGRTVASPVQRFLEPELTWRPLREGDLAYVAALEAQIHAAPWTQRNFRDAIAAGY